MRLYYVFVFSAIIFFSWILNETEGFEIMCSNFFHLSLIWNEFRESGIKLCDQVGLCSCNEITTICKYLVINAISDGFYLFIHFRNLLFKKNPHICCWINYHFILFLSILLRDSGLEVYMTESHYVPAMRLRRSIGIF